MASTEAQQILEVVKTQIAPLFAASVPVLQQRATFNGMGEQAQLPEGVTCTDVILGGISCDEVVPDVIESDTIVLYFHGGGNCLGTAASYRGLTTRLAVEGACKVLTVDYALAPENPFPKPLNDCYSVYCALLDSGIDASKIIIGGDSTGGGLVGSILLKLKAEDKALPKSAIMISPRTDFTMSCESFYGNKEIDPWLTPELLEFLGGVYTDGHDKTDPLVSPLLGDLSNLPPLLIHVGSLEILLDDSVEFAKKVNEAGGNAEIKVWDDLWHVFQFFAPAVPEANQALAEIGKFIKQ